MKQRKIGVGIIGANITSWAATAHIPALNLIPEFELIAVSTSKMPSAKEAAEKFGAKSTDFIVTFDYIPHRLHIQISFCLYFCTVNVSIKSKVNTA